MCQRSKAPPPRFHPLHRHELTALAASRDATRSACWSVKRSISPPCGAMTMSPVCVPSSSSRSTNSLLVSASASLKVGCGTCESSVALNSLVASSRCRPLSPIRTMVSGALLADLADRVERVLRVVALDPDLMSKGTPDRRELPGVGRAMLLVVDEVLLRGGQSLLDRCVIGSHQTLPASPTRSSSARSHRRTWRSRSPPRSGSRRAATR